MKPSRSPSSTPVTLPDLVVGAQVLDHLVRLQHVGADLAAPADLGLAPAGDGVQLGLALLLGLGGEHGLQLAMALSLFWCWLRSFWQVTTMPVGRWVMRTADRSR